MKAAEEPEDVDSSASSALPTTAKAGAGQAPEGLWKKAYVGDLEACRTGIDLLSANAYLAEEGYASGDGDEAVAPSSAPTPTSFDGIWDKATIDGIQLTWRKTGKLAPPLVYPCAKTVLLSQGGVTQKGSLQNDGSLLWDDGDVWRRATSDPAGKETRETRRLTREDLTAAKDRRRVRRAEQERQQEKARKGRLAARLPSPTRSSA